MKCPIYTCLWFQDQAKEAATFYCSVFENSSIVDDTGLVVIFNLNGQRIMALNGGPKYELSPSASLVVECDSQKEIDHYWEKLTKEGREEACGWLTDKFGLSWQIVPSMIGELMSDPIKAPRVMKELFQMKKIDLERLLKV